ncbi:MAG: hypothetical protein U0U66_12975 [Cytophagaceae bacterium]
MTIQLSTKHSEKNRVEAFLRVLNENFEQVPLDGQSLKESRRIEYAVKLANIDRSLSINILFVKDYDDANLIAKENFVKDNIHWGQNGSIMYVVESSNQDKVSNVLSVFAGRE